MEFYLDTSILLCVNDLILVPIKYQQVLMLSYIFNDDKYFLLNFTNRSLTCLVVSPSQSPTSAQYTFPAHPWEHQSRI